MHIYFVLTGAVETAQDSLFFPTLWCGFLLPIFSTFGLLMSKERLKGKGIMGCHSSLSFYDTTFSTSGWLIQGRKKGNDRVCWSCVPLKMPLPSLCVWKQLLVQLNHGLNTLTSYSLGVSLNSQTPWVPWSSGLLGHHVVATWKGERAAWALRLRMLVLRSATGLDSQNTRSKTESLGISVRWQQGIKPSTVQLHGMHTCVARSAD